MAIELIDKIKPKNNGSFAMVDAEDVAMPDGTRLSEYNPGTGLPDVTTSDNGKVLGVVNGVWKSVTAENLNLAGKEFVIDIFEQLKVLIADGKTDEAIAVLDAAILDLAILA